MSQLQEAAGIRNVFQHIGKDNNIEWLQQLQNCRREWLFMNFQAARASRCGSKRIRFEPNNAGIASVRDYAGHGAGATAYVQHARSHPHQLCQHACNFLRFVNMEVVTQWVEFAIFPGSEHLVNGIHVAVSATTADLLLRSTSLSQPVTVLRRCATMTIVSVPDRFHNASISFASVAVSSELVASSRRRSEGR